MPLSIRAIRLPSSSGHCKALEEDQKVRVREKSVYFFGSLFASWSIFLQWLYQFHGSPVDNPTLCDSSPISQTSPQLNFWLSQDGPHFQTLEALSS